MTTEISTNGITGTDGAVPVHLSSNLWQQWSLDQVYMGQEAAGRYVPNVKDYVIDPDTDERYRVLSLDPTTLVPVLQRIQPVAVTGVNDRDVLLGPVGLGNETYRVYVDKSVIPHSVSVDARLRVHGTLVTKAILFKGNPLLGNAQAISAFFDQAGVMLGQAIPLELAETTGANVAVRSIPVCYTRENLMDGEELYAEFYSDAGFVVSKCRLLVENTSFVRSPNAAVKYITGISLESPFLSSGDAKLIQYPLNVPLSGLNLVGVVNYSDGSKLRMPVDGTKFRMDGFSNFVSTIVGQKLPLVLTYNLSSDEVVYGASNINGNRHISESYRAIAINQDGSFTPKLFGYPVWIDGLHGYRMEWFLYNLDRNTVFRATPYVKFNQNTVVFDPLLYGVKQTLSVSVDLNDVSGIFDHYIHVQTIAVMLEAQGTERTSNWTIGFDPSQNPVYGGNNHAVSTAINQNLSKVKIDLGETNFAVWLERLFYRTKPLVDAQRENVAPEPNMFALVIGNLEVAYPIDMWNQEMTVSRALINNDTLFVKFFKRMADNDIQLAIAGLPMWQSN